MAQYDLIKEIVFIADEQYEAPAFAWGIALAYLFGLVIAEVLTVFVSPLVGIILYGLILIAVLVQSSLGVQKRLQHFLVILSIIPLIRLVAMTVPLVGFNPIYWYLLVGVLLGIAVFIAARLTGLTGSAIGLRISRQELPMQLLIGTTGLAIGLVEYLILRPDPYFIDYSWWQILLAGLILLVFAGLLQEIIFRGLLQTSATQILGRFGFLYAALVSALLYMGVRSSWNLLFVFLVSLAFGVVAARTRSLVGVSLSHGLANISFFLIFPLFMAGTAEKFDPPLVVSVPVINTPTHTVQVSPTQTNEPIVPQPLVLIPITGPTATSTQQFEQPAACGSHPNWVVYVTQPGDTLELIGARYGIDQVALRDANCFEDTRQLAAGWGLFVPYDLVLSPTPSLQVIFSALNTPTITPTKKPTRKPSASPTDNPIQEVTQTPALPTATRVPPTPPPQELPTLAPTQMPPPPPPPTQEN